MTIGGNKDQTLPTGRLAYGKASDGHFYPITVDANGKILSGSIVKAIQTEPLAFTAIAASTQGKSSVVALTNVLKATFFIDHGRAVTAGFGTNGPVYRIQVSEKASGNDTWRAATTFTAGSAACSSALSSGDVAAGTTVITILSGTAFVLADTVLWANVAAGSAEWATVVAVSGTATFTIRDATTNAQGSTIVITNKAEHFVYTLDAEGVTRARVIVDNNASGTTQNIWSRVACITESFNGS